MKPPHGNRPGGSGRPPSDRGPFRDPAGASQRPGGRGQGSSAQRQEGQREVGGGPSGQGRHGHGGGGRGGGDQGGYAASQSRGAEGPGGRLHGGAPKDGQRRRGPGEGGRPGGGQQQRPDRDRQSQRHGGPRFQHQHEGPRHGPDAPKGTVWLYGLHAVAAALANPARRLRRLLLTEEAEAVLIQRLPLPWALSAERVERARLDQMLGRDIAHQGAALLADPLAPPSLQSVLERPGPIIVLDQVTDPRNVGAILRSAAAFGAVAVIAQERNAPEENGALAKAASGALEILPLLRAVNIARTLIALKAANIWCVGLDTAGPPLSGPAFAGRRVALVLGAEGEGLRRLTKETCDEIAGLTIKGGTESLNVSAAAAVALYELTRQA